jgi:hypothetical protein
MSVELPYLMTVKRLPELFQKICSAAVPSRFSFEFLKNLGFASSNDRALPSLLKRLRFLDASGVPTDRYRHYRQPSESKRVLAQGLREVYSDLFAVNENADSISREELKGIISRITGAEERYVALMASTFTALASLADFTTPTEHEQEDESEAEEVAEMIEKPLKKSKGPIKEDVSDEETEKHERPRKIDFRNNIEIHLPATTNISVYNAIFKSIKEHLL